MHDTYSSSVEGIGAGDRSVFGGVQHFNNDNDPGSVAPIFAGGHLVFCLSRPGLYFIFPYLLVSLCRVIIILPRFHSVTAGMFPKGEADLVHHLMAKALQKVRVCAAD